MNVLDRRRTISSSPVVAFAVGALLADLSLVVIPWDFGSSRLTAAVQVNSFWVDAANLITVFSGVVAILVGVWFVRRGKMLVASGFFFGLFVVLGLRELASIVISIEGWVWQTIAVLALQAIECSLLFLAASAAARGQPAST